MGFNLSDAAEQNVNKVQWQKPGIYEKEVISKVNLGTASTGSKYLQFETESASGEIGKSPQMNLKTEKKEGSTVSAWQVTARNLKNYIMNTHNVTEAEADGMIEGIATEEALHAKVTALLVGKPFRAKYKGVETSKGFIIAELCGSESMKVSKEDSKLKYSVENDTVKYKGTIQAATPTFKVTVDVDSDLPF